MCLAVLWSEQAYLGLLAVSSLVLDHARACEAVGLSAGRCFFALVSRGGSSPAPFCLLASFAVVSSRRLSPQWVWAAFWWLLALVCVFSIGTASSR